MRVWSYAPPLFQLLDNVQVLECTSEGRHAQSTSEIVPSNGARHGVQKLLATLHFKCAGSSLLPSLPRSLGEAGWSRSALHMMMVAQ